MVYPFHVEFQSASDQSAVWGIIYGCIAAIGAPEGIHILYVTVVPGATIASPSNFNSANPSSSLVTIHLRAFSPLKIFSVVFSIIAVVLVPDVEKPPNVPSSKLNLELSPVAEITVTTLVNKLEAPLLSVAISFTLYVPDMYLDFYTYE